MKRKNIKPYEVLYHSLVLTYDLVERIVTEDEMVVLRSFMRNMIPVLEDRLHKAEEGLPVVGYNFGIPPEIFFCFDCIPFCFEATPYILSALLPNGVEYFYDKANAWGHPYHTCSSQKAIMGMILDGKLEFDAIITPTSPCDNAIASYQFFSNYYKIPCIMADIPAFYNNERSYEYYANELKRMVNDLSKILKQEPNFENMKNAIQNNARSQEYLLEIHDLKKVKPCPFESMINPIIAACTTLMPCTPEKTNFFREVVEVGKQRAKTGEGRKGIEKFRSVWPYMSVFYDFALYEWMDRELGVSQLWDIFNYYFYEPIKIDNNMSEDDLFYQLAVQGKHLPMNRQSLSSVDTLISDMIWLASEYKCDFTVIMEHLGCKQMAAISQLFREELMKQIGIPTLIIELDVGDKRMTPIETIKYQMNEFVKTLL
ncbi:MAG: 2-hydroxyacyl-CoA dehydratase [Candidatus Helarchaeota archaeon]